MSETKSNPRITSFPTGCGYQDYQDKALPARTQWRVNTTLGLYPCSIPHFCKPTICLSKNLTNTVCNNEGADPHGSIRTLEDIVSSHHVGVLVRRQWRMYFGFDFHRGHRQRHANVRLEVDLHKVCAAKDTLWTSCCSFATLLVERQKSQAKWTGGMFQAGSHSDGLAFHFNDSTTRRSEPNGLPCVVPLDWRNWFEVGQRREGGSVSGDCPSILTPPSVCTFALLAIYARTGGLQATDSEFLNTLAMRIKVGAWVIERYLGYKASSANLGGRRTKSAPTLRVHEHGHVPNLHGPICETTNEQTPWKHSQLTGRDEMLCTSRSPHLPNSSNTASGVLSNPRQNGRRYVTRPERELTALSLDVMEQTHRTTLPTLHSTTSAPSDEKWATLPRTGSGLSLGRVRCRRVPSATM